MSMTVSKVIDLPALQHNFKGNNVQSEELPNVGGILCAGDYSWLGRGPRLEVFRNQDGFKIWNWTFGWHLKRNSCNIICVVEIHRKQNRTPFLAVAMNSSNNGFICICDFTISKVIRTIKFNEKLSTLHVIDSGNNVFALPTNLLHNFDGILAVGSQGGEVYLVDICHQVCEEILEMNRFEEIESEENPVGILMITLRDILEVDEKKDIVNREKFHLALHLNVVFDNSTKHFVLKGPKGDDRIYVNKEEVAVSALHYCAPLGAILIGYNFGALQLYSLMELNLIYTSPICDDHIPISHFALQEPVDDPRAFCYIWAVYSGSDKYQTSLPFAVLYAFCYETKHHQGNFGYLYQNFQYASVHYQMELAEISELSGQPKCGYCIGLKSIQTSDSVDNNLTLCAFAWTLCFNDSANFETFYAIFDLNQWYKEQMPKKPTSKNKSLSYLVLKKFNSSTNNRKSEILDIFLNEKTLQQFIGSQRLEEHFSPISLQFDLYCLRQSDLIWLNNKSAQNCLLIEIQSIGPLCLIEPQRIYQKIVALGLLPLFCDLQSTTISEIEQRDIILNTALEYQLTGFLCKCAMKWANGCFISTGCSLDSLILWAFQRAITLKTNFDENAQILFDCSERKLDNNRISLLNNCKRQMNNLNKLFEFLLEKLRRFLTNIELVKEQLRSIESVATYMEVTNWLLSIGLLPEFAIERNRASSYLDFYDEKRAQLRSENEKRFGRKDSLLFIDKFIEIECNGNGLLFDEWSKDGGNGFYPPVSLQGLLRTYLIQNVNVLNKHIIVSYAFLDFAKTLDPERYGTAIMHLKNFPTQFHLQIGLKKLIHAFWHLDHGNCNSAIEFFLDTMLPPNQIEDWHHKIAIKSLILQGQSKLALSYFLTRKAPIIDKEDVFILISLYIANKMVNEAFEIWNKYRDYDKDSLLLDHLLHECSKNNLLKFALRHHYNDDAFLKHFEKCNNEECEKFKIRYHLSKLHLIEAVDCLKQFNGNVYAFKHRGLQGRFKSSEEEQLVYHFEQLLSDVYKKFLKTCQKERDTLWRINNDDDGQPKPMSVFLLNKQENAKYNGNIYKAAILKAKQTGMQQQHPDAFHTQDIPFLKSPITTTYHSKLQENTNCVKVINPIGIVVDQEDQDQDDDDDDDDLNEPIIKKQKLEACHSFISPILQTPFVYRKSQEKTTITNTPTAHSSILKVRENVENTPIGVVGIKARKSLIRTSSSSVRFQDLLKDEQTPEKEQEQEGNKSVLFRIPTPKSRRSLRFKNDDNEEERILTRTSLKRSFQSTLEETSSFNRSTVRRSLRREVLEKNTLENEEKIITISSQESPKTNEEEDQNDSTQTVIANDQIEENEKEEEEEKEGIATDKIEEDSENTIVPEVVNEESIDTQIDNEEEEQVNIVYDDLSLNKPELNENDEDELERDMFLRDNQDNTPPPSDSDKIEQVIEIVSSSDEAEILSQSHYSSSSSSSSSSGSLSQSEQQEQNEEEGDNDNNDDGEMNQSSSSDDLIWLNEEEVEIKNVQFQEEEQEGEEEEVSDENSNHSSISNISKDTNEIAPSSSKHEDDDDDDDEFKSLSINEDNENISHELPSSYKNSQQEEEDEDEENKSAQETSDKQDENSNEESDVWIPKELFDSEEEEQYKQDTTSEPLQELYVIAEKQEEETKEEKETPSEIEKEESPPKRVLRGRTVSADTKRRNRNDSSTHDEIVEVQKKMETRQLRTRQISLDEDMERPKSRTRRPKSATLIKNKTSDDEEHSLLLADRRVTRRQKNILEQQTVTKPVVILNRISIENKTENEEKKKKTETKGGKGKRATSRPSSSNSTESNPSNKKRTRSASLDELIQQQSPPQKRYRNTKQKQQENKNRRAMSEPVETKPTKRNLRPRKNTPTPTLPQIPEIDEKKETPNKRTHKQKTRK